MPDVLTGYTTVYFSVPVYRRVNFILPIVPDPVTGDYQLLNIDGTTLLNTDSDTLLNTTQ